MVPTAAQLAPHYRAFLRPGRVLLTGHSHQAWPDAAREGLLESFEDAALAVDHKWERAFAAAEELRVSLAERLGGEASQYALGANTHELVLRFLSALDLRERRHLVTTSGEFHSIYRQLRRLQEEGVRVDFVPAEPVSTLASRLADAVRPETAAVLVSAVLFESSSVVPELGALHARLADAETELLLDGYHAAGALAWRLAEQFPRAWVTGGGYKYLQWGEGVCYLRVPSHSRHRPVLTGWFADFAHLADRRADLAVQYAERGAERFAGSTYDPASHYRARAVDRFFRAQGLTPAALAASYARQTRVLLEALGDWPTRTPREEGARGGFVAVPVQDPSGALAALEREGILADARGACVRLGPAPYLEDEALLRGVRALQRAATPLRA